jgi:hypothetical protein
LVLNLAFKPLATDGLNSTQSGALLSNILTLFVGIMLIITADMEDAAKRAGEAFDSTERDIISWLIVIVNMLVMAIPFLNFILDGNIVKKVVTIISCQVSNKEERETIAAMIKERNDQMKKISNNRLAAQGAQVYALGSSFTAPTTQLGSDLLESAAPANLQGDFVFLPQQYHSDPFVGTPPQHQLLRPYRDNSQIWNLHSTSGLRFLNAPPEFKIDKAKSGLA